MNIRSSILYGLILSAPFAFGLEATLEVVPPKITLDESAIVAIAVNDDNATRPELPRIEGFLISDAGKTWKTDATNRWTVFKYRFHPAHPGTFKIGPFDYTHQSESVSLTGELVVTPDTKPPTISKQLFDPAAREYIHGNTEVASNNVERALTRFPADEKLLKLKKLIEEQQKNKDQQKQDQKDQQKKDDQKKQQDQQQQQSGQNKQKDEKQQQQDQQNRQQDQQKQSDQSKESGQDKEQPQPSQPQQAGEMSKEEARQLLDAMKQDEQDQRVNLKPFLGGPVRVEKDW